MSLRALTQLTTLVLAASATTACIDGGHDLGLDGLPSYDEETGSTCKGDDASCSDVTYREFIQAYFRSEAAADTNPCKSGNDASYRIWAYVANEQLEPLFTRYRNTITQRFSRLATKEQVAAASALDAATQEALARLEAIRPAHAGKVGYAAWRELYKPALELATRPIGENTLTPDAVDQQAYEITSAEAVWLEYVERTQPTMTEEHGYTLWWEVAGPVYKAANASDAPGAAAFVARLGATHPAGNTDEDATTFQSEVTAKVAEAYASSNPSTAAWRGALDLMPSGGGDTAYRVWATAFADLAVDLNARTRSEPQRHLFQLVADARPCASGPEVDAIVESLTTGLAAAGDAPDGRSLASIAVPVACATP